jgi:hypothetical protein
MMARFVKRATAQKIGYRSRPRPNGSVLGDLHKIESKQGILLLPSAAKAWLMSASSEMSVISSTAGRAPSASSATAESSPIKLSWWQMNRAGKSGGCLV